MAIPYPWPAPPQRERRTVRLRPGKDPNDVAVLEWAGESFVGLRTAGDRECDAAADPMVFATPGLLDLQINGYWGRGFSDVDLGPEGIRDLCWSIALSGTTSFLPTITTDAPEAMQAAMANKAMALTTFFIFASTPIQSIGYNPDNGALSARFRLGDKTSLVMGTNQEKEQNVGLRRRIGKGFILSTSVNRDPEDNQTTGSAFIEWHKRY